jgi:hypothetical protein
MKITIHEAECNVGYARPILRSMRREDLVKEIAATCRKDWNSNDWGELASPPPIPEADEVAISTYFHAPDTPEGPWIRWSSFEVDLSVPDGVTVDLSVERPFLTRRTAARFAKGSYQGEGAVTEGALLEGGGVPSDVLEGFILALTAAGFPVHLPEFRLTLADYCGQLSNLIE